MINKILRDSTKFEGVDDYKNFCEIFTNLYQISIFKDGLDLILTKARSGQLKFEVKLIKDWDTNVGCYLTQQRKIHNKFLNIFTNVLDHKIIIKSLSSNVLSHEMAHCLEFESEIDLNCGFRKAIALDMNSDISNNLALKSHIKRLMVDAVKSYPKYQIISELFARYFELLSVSRAINLSGDFSQEQVNSFFINTSNWIQDKFNPQIKSKIDLDISRYSLEIISANNFKSEKTFADKEKSFYKKADSKGIKSWSGNVNSNARWQNSWQNHNDKEN